MAIPNLKNYSSRVPAIETAGQIIALLARHGAGKIMQGFKDGEVVSVCWLAQTPQGAVPYQLPVDAERCFRVMLKQGLVADTPAGRGQAARTAWRIVKDWIDSQMAMLQTEMVDFEQLVLPYTIARDGKTLYQHMIDGGFAQFALPEGRDDG